MFLYKRKYSHLHYTRCSYRSVSNLVIWYKVPLVHYYIPHNTYLHKQHPQQRHMDVHINKELQTTLASRCYLGAVSVPSMPQLLVLSA